jgi:fibronectin type 3 domain-containing protein
VPFQRHFDLSAGAAFPPGYTTVRGGDVYTPARGYGWQAPAGEFDRGLPDALLRDGHWGSAANTFLLDVPNGQYVVTVTMGDQQWARDHDDVYAEGVRVLHDVASAAGQFGHYTFVTTVTDGQLAVLFVNDGGDPYWVVNALDVRPVQGTLTFAADPAGPLAADGASTDTFHGSWATPGSLVTLTTSLGTLVGTDASPSYAGFQVQADAAGGFAFTIQRSYAGGASTIHAEEVSGATAGTTTRVYALLPVRRFDFNGPAGATAAGFIGVQGSDVYSASRGYGWVTPAGEFDRGTASSTPVELYRDGHWGQVNTFRIQVRPGVPYDVRVYVGDQQWARDFIRVRAEGSGDPAYNVIVPSTPAGQFATATLTNIVSADGVLDLEVRDLGGDPFFVLNGLDRAESSAGLPGLTAGPGGPSMSERIPFEALLEDKPGTPQPAPLEAPAVVPFFGGIRPVDDAAIATPLELLGSSDVPRMLPRARQSQVVDALFSALGNEFFEEI